MSTRTWCEHVRQAPSQAEVTDCAVRARTPARRRGKRVEGPPEAHLNLWFQVLTLLPHIRCGPADPVRRFPFELAASSSRPEWASQRRRRLSRCWILSLFGRNATIRARACITGGWGRIRRAGQGVEFGGYAGGFGRADPLEDCQRLPEPVFGLGGAAGGLGAPAQPGQRLRLFQGDAELAGHVQGLLMTGTGLAEATADPA